MTKPIIFLTTGITKSIAGNATTKAKPHALSHMDRILFTKPILNVLMTNDIMQDISNAIKNANTSC